MSVLLFRKHAVRGCTSSVVAVNLQCLAILHAVGFLGQRHPLIDGNTCLPMAGDCYCPPGHWCSMKPMHKDPAADVRAEHCLSKQDASRFLRNGGIQCLMSLTIDVVVCKLQPAVDLHFVSA